MRNRTKKKRSTLAVVRVGEDGANGGASFRVREICLVKNLVRLCTRGIVVVEFPVERRITSFLSSRQAVVDLALLGAVATPIVVKALREDVDGLIPWPSQMMC